MLALRLLERKLHERYLLALNLYRFIHSEPFKAAFEIANTDEQVIAQKHIELSNQNELVCWVKLTLRKYEIYDFLDLKDLRDIARISGIPGYCSLSKIDLIIELRQKPKEEINDANGKTNYYVKN